jgi:hypothetical protein
MRKYILIIAVLLNTTLFAQSPGIKSDLPTVIPPSPTVAALMKFEEVPVSNYTGLPDISVPIFSSPTLTKGVDINIALKYHAANTKVKENASDVGMGWSLFAGGTISRTVRGMPDEVIGEGKVGIYNSFYQTNNNYYKALENYNTAINSTIPNMNLEDYREFLFHVDTKGLYDTQHDLWQFNFLNQSGRFIVVKNNNNQLEVQLLENSTLKIYPIVDSQYQFRIIGFNIYDDLGNNYKFDVSESTISTSFNDITHYDNTESNSLNSYNFLSAFHLSKVFSSNNQQVLNITYLGESLEHVNFSSSIFSSSLLPTININDDISALTNGPDCFVGFNISTFYIPKSEISIGSLKCSTKKINEINIINIGKIQFEYQTGREDDKFTDNQNSKVLDKIIVRNLNNEIIRNFVLNRIYINAPTKKMFLSTVKEIKNGQTENHYKFSYKESSVTNGTEDAWGYFKENDLNFPNKEVDIQNVDSFVLKRMDVLTGGAALFDYEPNSFTYIGAVEVENFKNNLNNYNVNYHSNSINSFNVTYSAFVINSEENKIVIDCNVNTNTFDWFLAIYHNGQLYRTISNNLCVNGICKAYISNLPVGNYSVKLTTVNLNAAINSGFPFNVNYIVKSLKSSNEQELYNYGGGFRIKKISYFDNLEENQSPITGQEARSINYDYNFFGQNKSSGSLNSNIPIYEFLSTKIRPEIRGTCQSSSGGYSLSQQKDIPYIKVSEQDLNNKNLTKGSEVGYKNITVFQTGNGYSEYTYTSSMDYEDTILGNPPHLIVAPINFDYKRGLLINEKKLNNDNKIFSNVEYNYTFEDNVVVSGLNVYGTFYSTYYSNPVYKMFPNYNQYISFKTQNYCEPGYPTANICSVDNHNNTFKKQLDIKHIPVQEAYGWAKLASKTTKNYFYPNGGTTPNIVTSNETFTYNPINKQIASHTVNNSVGETLTTNYFYHTGNSSFSQNRISEIERIETKRGSELLSESKINYSNTFAGNQSFLPSTIEVKKGNSPSEIRLRNNVYDEFGHVLEMQQESGMKISYIYGYNKTQPVAKIENMDYASIPTNLITAIQNASNGTNEQALIDALNNLRLALPNAMVSTYTHIPLKGVRTVIDPKGDKQTYHYDNFNRLQFVKDSSGNILSENEYHYKN